MLGIDDTEARLKFGREVNRLRRKGYTKGEIAERLLGNSKYTRGVTKLSGAGYMARLEIQSGSQRS